VRLNRDVCVMIVEVSGLVSVFQSVSGFVNIYFNFI
jgi:hypothetical protein